MKKKGVLVDVDLDIIFFYFGAEAIWCRLLLLLISVEKEDGVMSGLISSGGDGGGCVMTDM